MRRTLLHLSMVSMAALALAPAAPASAWAQEAWHDAWAAEDSTPPKPFAEFSRSALSLRDSIVALARSQIGRRYVRGGTSPSHGFDCSGLVRYIASALHMSIPRTARQQARVGEAIPADTARLLPGDLLTFGRGTRISHIGIYVGNGRFVHASTKAGRVIETNLLRAPAPGIKPWRGARRLVLSDSLALTPADSAS
jgi:cell wall-associated NlpC family hydrolase